MARIVPGIDSLEQHLKQLQHDPEVYRPNCCPHCGKSGVHRHGHYDRNTPRGTGLALSLGPLRILRFFCSTCRRTCSRLPACLAPWRQYLWSVQQVVLEWLLAGGTLRQAARRYSPSRRTIGRWWQWLKARFEEQSFHLRSRFPELGRTVNWQGFWSSCLQRMRLCEAMVWLDREGVAVP